jgi:hypothetical protein
MVWEIFNETPFAVERSFLRDRSGVEVWQAALRASFDVLADGRLRCAEKQTPPRLTASWWGAPGRSSLEDDTDFVLARRGTDVLVQGLAHAPRGRPARAVEVELRGPHLAKRLRATGERRWERAAGARGVVRPGEPEPFSTLPIVYEQAFGGAQNEAEPTEGGRSESERQATAPVARQCEQNPVGTGYCLDPESVVGTAAPRLERVGAPLAAGPHQTPPAGLGPIAQHWEPRRSLAGTYDAAWLAERAPLLPGDCQDDHFRAAPGDQQLPAFLRGGEVFELLNLSPEGYLCVRLPRLEVSVTTVFTGESERCAAPLETLRLLPEQRRVELSFVARLPCHGREQRLLRGVVHCRGARACR